MSRIQIANPNTVTLQPSVNDVDGMGTNANSTKRAIHSESSKQNGIGGGGSNTSSGSRKSAANQYRRNSSSSLLNESSGNGRTENDTAPTSTDNSGNSEQSDNTVIFIPPSKPAPSKPDVISSRNPVLDRLTGQLPNHNSLRNESYYRVSDAVVW